MGVGGGSGHLLADGGVGGGDEAGAAPAEVLPLALLGEELQLPALGRIQRIAVLGLGEKWGADGPRWEVGGQAVLGRQLCLSTPWLTERRGYERTCEFF